MPRTARSARAGTGTRRSSSAGGRSRSTPGATGSRSGRPASPDPTTRGSVRPIGPTRAPRPTWALRSVLPISPTRARGRPAGRRFALGVTGRARDVPGRLTRPRVAAWAPDPGCDLVPRPLGAALGPPQRDRHHAPSSTRSHADAHPPEPGSRATAGARQPRGREAQGRHVLHDHRVGQPDRPQVGCALLGVQALEREPQRRQQHQQVVELAEHRDDAGDEVDR